MKFWNQENRIFKRLQRLYPKQAEACLRRMEMLIGRYEVEFDCKTANCNCGWNQTDSVLITYADMIKEEDKTPLVSLKEFADKYLKDAITNIHILPFFPYSSDDGFSVIDYRKVNAEVGEWHDITALTENFSLGFDLVLNHVSSKSQWLQDYCAGVLPAREYFIEVNSKEDLSLVVRPRTQPLLAKINTQDGETCLWATFSHDQLDLNFANPDVLFEFLDILLLYISMGARIIRLDAIAYLWKEPGTSCIHLPQTHEVVKLMRDFLDAVAPQVILLTETNVPHQENISYFGTGDEAKMIYQFTLPPLLIHALLNANASYLTTWAASLEDPPPGCTFLNFTASHDGIGVRPLEGIVPEAEVTALVNRVRERGGQVSSKQNSDGSESPYELNITYFDLLCEGEEATGLDQRRFLCSQAIALAMRGIPAVYFHSLTATRNDLDGVRTLGFARAINRSKWQRSKLEKLLADKSSLTAQVFEAYLKMLRLRALHVAFHPDAKQRVWDFGKKFFALERLSPVADERIVAISNITNSKVSIKRDNSLCSLVGVRDLLTNGRSGGKNGSLQFGPYQTRWLVMPV